MKLAFLSSHGGSGMRAVLSAVQRGELHATPVLCISNNSGSPALTHARDAGLDTLHLSARRHPDPADLDRAMLDALHDAQADTVVLSGYMKALGPQVLAAYHGRLVNVHPSLLPSYGGRGMYGDLVHTAVLAAGESESGATVHLVEEGIDEGPILAQQRVPVLPGDTLATLRARVMAVEGPLLVGALRDLGGHAPD
ncbi:phosphoribosylglycinamide formyltransferase [Deinococcus aquiradiocola]|uniref:Phosphoribosylglycinamide formyltransferase n=1 Tax=Deinococcus aquiradiocola TaxID=393059 RepID=A0A917P566_9DEIO|nr:phosphoribosylglycinamide formyltransferase [Deinococcus aquiradiocola]GGJ61940.1 phosphoribosylglycinamide formyltransferase [Deinococcus aquiradiocola]